MEPNDSNDLERRLAGERPRLTGAELDAAGRRIRARARPHRSSLHSRFALISVLVCGLLFSTAGAGLAISGAAGQGDAAGTNYSNPPGNVLGVSGSGGKTSGGTGTRSGDPSRNQGDSANQTTRQVAESSGGTLPFTGYAGIVVLALGLGLLGAGLVLRRTASRTS